MVALFVGVALAGCTSGGDQQVPAGTSTAPSAPQVEVSGDFGAIQGLVVDSSYVPVPGANVTLTRVGSDDASRMIVTNVEGQFAFSGLRPGTFEVAVEAGLFAPGRALVQVEAASVREVVVTLSEVAAAVPYVEFFVEPGIVGCGFGAVVIGGECGDEPVTTANRNRFAFEVPEGHQAIVSEVDWERTSDAVSVRYGLKENVSEGGNGELIGLIIDTPVLRGEFYPGQPGPPGFAGETPVPVPDSERAFVLFLSTAYVGAYQEEFNETLGPVCDALIGSCYGVGVAPDFRFTHYVTVFVNDKPADLAFYTGVPDA